MTENEMKEALRKKGRDKIVAMIRDNPDILGLKEGEKIEDQSDEQLITSLATILTGGKSQKTKESEEAATEEKTEENAEAKAEEKTEEKTEDKPAEKTEAKAEGTPEEGVKESALAKELGEEAMARWKKFDSDLRMKEALEDSKLPDPVKDKLKKLWTGRIIEAEELDMTIKAEKETLARLTESGQVKGMGKVEVGASSGEKIQLAMDAMIDPEVVNDEGMKESYKDVPKSSSIRELYGRITGDKDVTGHKPLGQRMTEASQSSDFTNMLGTSMERRMVREYRRLIAKESWQKFVSIESPTNFKQQDIIRVGGFANLSTVAEKGTYTEFSTPSEEEPNYTVSKRGNTFLITREMIKNDDMRALKVFPMRMANAANRTLSKFVFGLLIGDTDNVSSGLINTDTIYDSVVLYHDASHGNISTSALSFTTLDAAITAMANQAEADSSEPLNIQARYLVVPHELRSLAKLLVDSKTKPSSLTASDVTNSEANPVYKAVEPIVVPNYYLGADTNNWYVVGDPADAEGILVGFLDGKQEPELLVQDAETVAVVFTNDQITYKVRHEYSGCIVDYRPTYGGIVA